MIQYNKHEIGLHIPFAVRLWRAWCKYGPKNKFGVIGGSFILRRLRTYYSWNQAVVDDSYLLVGGKHRLFIDPLDLRTYQMVIPQIEAIDNEIVLATCITTENGVFVDVGANVGVLSLCALLGGALSVHSFEPNCQMMKRLKMTRASYESLYRWHLYEFAVGSKCERLNFYVDSNFSGTASFHGGWQSTGVETISVELITLDDSCKEWGDVDVAVIKMDVEGWEPEVIKGAKKTIEKHKPYLWFEYNVAMMKRIGMKASQVVELIRDLGYERFFDIGLLPQHAGWTIEDVLKLEKGRYNILAVPEDRLDDFDRRVRLCFSRNSVFT